MSHDPVGECTVAPATGSPSPHRAVTGPSCWRLILPKTGSRALPALRSPARRRTRPARLVALAVAKECWCCRRRPHGQSSEIMMVPAHTSSFFVIEHHHRNETQISGHPFTGNGSDLHPTGIMTKTNTSTIMIPIIIAHIHSLVASFGFIYYNNSLNMSPL